MNDRLKPVVRSLWWLSVVWGVLLPAAANTETTRLQCAVTQVAPDDVLNIRDAPTPKSRKVGTIPHDATTVTALGQTQPVNGGAWRRIVYNARTGWVNARFLRCPLPPAEAKTALAGRAREAIAALKARDLDRFSRYVHPAKGVRFSPYAYVDSEHDVVVPAAQIARLFADDSPRQWGYYDGTGDPIVASFAQYFDRFVYSHGFAESDAVGYNQIRKTGNTVDNSRAVYPEAIIVDYHLAAQDSDLDWASLRLVFERFQGRWYISGLIHDEWTI